MGGQEDKSEGDVGGRSPGEKGIGGNPAVRKHSGTLDRGLERYVGGRVFLLFSWSGKLVMGLSETTIYFRTKGENLRTLDLGRRKVSSLVFPVH